jgi:hypothetical protein
MSYTLAAAAKATGLNRSTILKAIKGGRIAGTKDKLGKWHVDPAELHLVYRAVGEPAVGGNAQQSAASDVAALGTQIEALIRSAGERLQQQLDQVRREEQAES